MTDSVRIEYVEARRVLLDVLGALREQLNAIVIVGAQAIYLLGPDRLPTYQPFTTDADLVLDPGQLRDQPPLGAAMESAGLVFSGEPGIWEARFQRSGFDSDVVVPVDLIVPAEVASRAGRRSARLAGDHGADSARKTRGVEGALVDHEPVVVHALDPSDDRSITVNVAGVAAMLVAKLHKLGDRSTNPERLEDKDAGDVYRLFDLVAPAVMARRIAVLLADERSVGATVDAIAYGDSLFGSSSGIGVQRGVNALQGVIPESTVAALFTGYWREFRADRTLGAFDPQSEDFDD